MRSIAAVLVLALAPFTSCATVLGTAISPITGPVDVVRLISERGWEWRDAYVLPLGILLSPLMGLLTGMDTDYHIVDPGWEWPVQHILRPFYNMPGH